jgi:signal transduction histidine kinase
MTGPTVLPRATAARSGPAARTTRRRLGTRWHRPGTAARLATLYALVLLVVLGGVVAALVENFTASYQTVLGQSLAAEAGSFRQAALARPVGQDLTTFTTAYLRGHALPAGEIVMVWVARQGAVGSPGTRALLGNAVVRGVLANPPHSTTLLNTNLSGSPVELLFTPVVAGPTVQGTFVASADMSAFAQERSKLLAISIIGAVVALGVAVISAFILLRRLLRQVGGITQAANDISAGDLQRRLGDQGTDDEVGELAQSFDSMLDHLDTAVAAQRRLLADVSHQLRTPLTVARGQLEVLERTDLNNPAAVSETVALVIDELEHMRALVDRMLQLGRAMERDQLIRETVDVRSFVSDVFDASRVLASRRWMLRPLPDVVLDVDVAKMRGSLLNLVDNAIKATNSDDAIALGAQVSSDRRWVILSVEDSGPGVPAAQRSAVLHRFARPGARDADGTGLGLAIVKAVAEAHGGRVDIGESDLGGAAVTISIPRVATAAIGSA